ncbi:uncharacterized protein LOC110419437 [Herrania umbratica]|uniref:Uncharacterized protein LOC110419437 n=1 Tax=Herrania umbratica TaxID=108875 RepID=A0A6J1AMU6_9ROSI|nr:uncharacterized protein LOC110419437 [Herrania umbratica]
MEHDRSACSSMSFVMLGCLWTKEAKERQLQLKEKQHQQPKQAKELTLEDWLIASPGLQKHSGTGGGEYHVLKHSSKRVFPSFVGENAHTSSKPRENFSKERLLKFEDDEREDMEVSLSRSQSGKSKKRVSFRQPEEADIFIFHSSSSEEESGEREN